MPGPMPFHLEKGPWVIELENHLNESPDSALQALTLLRKGIREVIEPYVARPVLNLDPVYKTAAARERHLTEHWFGDTDQGQQPAFESWLEDWLTRHGVQVGQPPGLDAPARISSMMNLARTSGVLEQVVRWPTTGFWRQYYGDVAAITQQTLITALEISLGLPTGQPNSGESPTRHLTLEIFWKCPQPWFEGWVTWRLHPETSDLGQVTVVFATPGSGTPVLQRAATGLNARVSPSIPIGASSGTGSGRLGAQPRGQVADRGLWVITHEQNVLLPNPPAIRPTGHGDWLDIVPTIGPAYAGVGDVQIVQPSLADGGVVTTYEFQSLLDSTSAGASAQQSQRKTGGK